jgi:hypothetical protein
LSSASVKASSLSGGKQSPKKSGTPPSDVPRPNVILTDLLHLTLRFLSELEVITDHFRALGRERL